MKRIIKRIVVSILIVSLFVPANLKVSGSYAGVSDEVLTEGDFQYKLLSEDNNKMASIYGYTGGDSKIVIPETIGGYKVIEVNSLDGSKTVIESILLSKNIKSVSSNLEQVNSKGKVRFIEIEKYEVANENSYLSAKDGVLFNKKQTILLNYPRGKKNQKYTEPSTVEKSLGANRNPYVKKWILSSNKKYVKTENYAYRDYANLEEITIPKNIKKIAIYSFKNCKNLKNINWNNRLERIGDSAFENCSSLTSVKIPDTVLSIADSSFKNCNLSSAKLSKRLTYIGSYAFTGNSKLKKVKIPDAVTKMNKMAFNTKTTKVIMPSYMKRQEGHFNNYIAKATVTNKGQTQDYKAIYITKIKPVKKKVTIKKGTPQKLKTKVYIRNNDTKLKKSGILKTNILQFSSSNPKVATVTSSGKVKALKKGKTFITVTLKTAKESYKTAAIVGVDGIVDTAATKMTKKSFKIKVTVKK